MTLALILSAAGGITAFADVSLEECDRCFQTTVNGFLEQDDVDGNRIRAERKPVYTESNSADNAVCLYTMASARRLNNYIRI